MPLSFSEHLTQLYNELASCIKSFHQPQLTFKHLKSVDKIARETQSLVKLYPDAFFGQIQMPKKYHSFRVNLTFNCLCLTLLIGKLHKWNESSLHQLLCAAITSFVHQQALLEKSYQGKEKSSFSKLNQGNPRLIKLIELAKQKIWHNGAKNEPHTHGSQAITQIKALERIPLERQILFVSRWLSLQITPNKRITRQTFAQIAQNLSFMLPAGCYQLISPLVKYPSLYSPGSVIQTASNLLYRVLSITDGGLIVRRYDRATGQCSDNIELISSDTVIKSYPPTLLENVNDIDSLWDDNWRGSYAELSLANKLTSANYRVDKPPALLLAIQDQMGRSEVDIERVCKLILREQSFSHYLQETASKNSRQQLPVESVKHALMIHGLGRTQSIITQQALMMRLTQNTFPLLPVLNKFTLLAGAFSEHIAYHTPLFLPEEVSTFMSFVCASLYTDVQFKRMIFHVDGVNDELRAMVTPNQNPAFLEHAKKLANAWQQDSISLKTINYLCSETTNAKISKRVRTLSDITQLSLAMARLNLFSRSKSDLHLAKQARASLSLDDSAYKNIQTLATSALFSALYR